MGKNKQTNKNNILCFQVAQSNPRHRKWVWERDFNSELLSVHARDDFKGYWIKWSRENLIEYFFFNESRNKNDDTFYIMDNLQYCIFIDWNLIMVFMWEHQIGFHTLIFIDTLISGPLGISKWEIMHRHTHTHTYSHSCSEDIYFNQLCLLLIFGVLGITSRPFHIIFFYVKFT